MKKILVLLLAISCIVVLTSISSGCGSNTTMRVIPAQTRTITPTTPSTTSSATSHMFLFVRTVAGSGAASPMTQQQIVAARQEAKAAHAVDRQAPIAVAPAPSDIYVVPFLYSTGWWYDTERKITASPDAYTSVYLSENETTLVYSAVVNGYNQIFTTTVPSAGQTLGTATQLTSDSEQHWAPHLSADGSKVAFTKFDANSNGDVLCLINNTEGSAENCLDFSSTTPVLKGANLWHASWSGNDKIVFEAWGGPLNSDDIFLVNADGSGLSQITSNAGTKSYDESPSVSREGTSMVVSTWNDAIQYFEVIEINLNTKERMKISASEYTHLNGWDPLYTYYTIVWVSQSDSDTGPQLYIDLMFDLGALTTNANANFFENRPR